jgi:hypothetical protein
MHEATLFPALHPIRGHGQSIPNYNLFQFIGQRDLLAVDVYRSWTANCLFVLFCRLVPC